MDAKLVESSERNPRWETLECIGKFAFLYLAGISLLLLVVGLVTLTSDGGSVAVALLTFGITRMANFIFFSSLSHLVTFWYDRKNQMKQSAKVLATEEGKKKWDEPSRLTVCLSNTGLLSKQPPNYMWNKYIGENLSFDDLPLHAPDYPWCVKISLICCSCTIHEHRPKNSEGVIQQVCMII